MSDDIGLLDNYEQMATCSQCETELEWVDCDQCGGEGDYDCYEEDPLWYQPGDTKPCAQCGGVGGWYWCDVCKAVD